MHRAQATSQIAPLAEESELFVLLQELRTRWSEEAEFADEAMRELCLRVEGAVRRLAGRALRTAFELEDLRQEGLVALLVAMRRSGVFEESGSTAHLHRVLRARMVDLARRSSARKRSGVPTERLSELAPGDHDRALARESVDPLAEPELTERLSVALSALPREQRLALEARALEGLATSEVAQRLGRSEEAVRQLLLRARRRLRRALGAD